MRACDQCLEKATCAYSFGGGAERFACADHDPWQQPGGMTVMTTTGFTYRSLLEPLATTGHLGVQGHDPPAPQVVYPGTAASPGTVMVGGWAYPQGTAPIPLRGY